MKSFVAEWVEGYATRIQYIPETIKSLRIVNNLMSVQSFVIAVLFWGPSSVFMRPTTPPDDTWLSLAFWGSGIEIWDFAFVIGAILLLLSTAALQWVGAAHGFLSVTWALLGTLWVIGGMFVAPSYLFGAGVFALFISAQHASMIRIWKAEGVS